MCPPTWTRARERAWRGDSCSGHFERADSATAAALPAEMSRAESSGGIRGSALRVIYTRHGASPGRAHCSPRGFDAAAGVLLFRRRQMLWWAGFHEPKIFAQRPSARFEREPTMPLVRVSSGYTHTRARAPYRRVLKRRRRERLSCLSREHRHAAAENRSRRGQAPCCNRRLRWRSEGCRTGDGHQKRAG